MQSARAIHRAALSALEARFFTDWCRRPPYTSFHPRFLAAVSRLEAWPAPEGYEDLAAQVPRAEPAILPRFVAQDREQLRQLGGYEPHVARKRAVPTRPRSWHDFFNMAIWAHFPRTRWALNAIHVDETLGPIDPRNGRAPPQNVAAQFDESGIVVASSSPSLLAELRALRFKHVFWERRHELETTTRFWVVGHGMLESLLAPHPRLAGKALLLDLPQAPSSYDDDALREDVDARVASLIASWHAGTPLLEPLPLLGVPGFADNAAPEFYDNDSYFRFERRR